MSDGEVEHQHWVHAQLDPSLKTIVAGWPYVAQESFAGVRVVFLHYEPADTDSGFAPIHPNAGPEELDRLFGHYGADVIFYGHAHRAADVQGRAQYVNPGALGCYREALARYVVLDCTAGRYTVEQRAVPYDDRPLFDAFERRQVPERALLYQAFFGGRFGELD
jgi:hypothetical protein